MIKKFDKRFFLPYIRKKQTAIASSSNGRTADSDSVNLGSSPGEAATNEPPKGGFFLVADLSLGSNQLGIASHGGNCRRVVRSSGFMPDTSR